MTALMYESSAIASEVAGTPRWPRVARRDAGVICVDEWIVRAAQQQDTVVDAFVSEWTRAAWPEGLLSINFFASTGGSTVLSYAQWKSDEMHERYMRSESRTLMEQFERGIPDIEHGTSGRYKVYRSRVHDDVSCSGCLVLVSVRLAMPDELRQRRWVDTVIDALDSEEEPQPGWLANHFHISTDGTRVLNYSEWTDEAAHCEALERFGRSIGGREGKWRDVHRFPGVVCRGYKRYRLAADLSAAHVVGC